MNNNFLRLAFAASLLALLAGPASTWAQAPQAAPAKTSPTRAAPDFRPLVRAALDGGAKRIVIAPGVYRIAPEAGQNVVWTLQNLRDVEIVADGVTLICTKLTRAIELKTCVNVSLRGFRVDYDPLPFTQGTVISASPDKSWIDVRLHAGYPRRAYSRIDVVDPRTRFRKRGMPFLWGTKAELTAPDVVRVSLQGIGDAAAVGDLASLSTGPDREAGGIDHGITIEGCSGTTLRDVTLHCAPGMGILEADGEGGAKYLGCRIVRGPRPEGATEERLLTTSWDAMQSKTIRRGPLVENCVIEEAGDDSWSVQSSDYLLVKRDGLRLTLASRDEWTDGVQIGDRLRTSNASPEATIVARRVLYRDAAALDAGVLEKLGAAKAWDFWSVSRKCFEVTLDREPPFSVGDSVFSPDRQGAGFIFRNNRLHSAGRVLIKAGGLVENNLLDNAHALVVCPELPNQSAAGIRGLVIRGNTIRGTGYFCPAPWSTQAGAISITCSRGPSSLRAPGVFEDLVIENNTIQDVNGPCLVIGSARNVRIKGNRFLSAQQTAPNATGASYNIAREAVIWMAESEDVQLAGNEVDRLGSFAKKIVVLEPSVQQVKGADSGVSVR